MTVPGPYEEPTVKEPHPPGRKVTRRGLIRGSTAFVAGGASAILSGYLTDYLKATNPPGEQVDLSSNEDALRVTILRERSASQQGELWIFPYLLSGRPEVSKRVTEGFDSDDERVNFFYLNGAMDLNVTRLKVIAEGRRNSSVTITAMRAKTVKKEPLSGCTLLTPGPQGAGESAKLGFDLDAKDSSALEIDNAGPKSVYLPDFFKEPYFQGKTISLARTEQQVIQVTARTFQYYVEWYLEVDTLDNGKKSTYQFGINNNPIRTCAAYYDKSAGDPTNPIESKYAEVYLDSSFTVDGSKNVNSSTFVRSK